MEQMNIARFLHIGMTKLGYTEEQVFFMTPRKFFKIYDQFLIISGVKKEEDEYAIDALL